MFLENNYDEIVLPDVESTKSSSDFVVIPLEKYEVMIKENAKVDVLLDYLLSSKKPSVAVVKSILRIPHNG